MKIATIYKTKFHMKSLLLPVLLWLFILPGRATAQATFSIAPAISSAQVGPNSDTVARATITNLTNQTLALTWIREVLMIQPATAATAVLDPYISYPPFTSTQNFSLMPGDSGELSIVYFNYSMDPGCALVRIRVINQNNPADTASVLYRINDCASAANDLMTKSTIRLYPNPFSESFRLEDAEDVVKLRFIQTDGREVLRLAAVPEQVYTPVGLPPGMFIVILEDTAGKTVQSFLIQKTP